MEATVIIGARTEEHLRQVKALDDASARTPLAPARLHPARPAAAFILSSGYRATTRRRPAS